MSYSYLVHSLFFYLILLHFFLFFFFFLMIRRPPRSTLFPTRRSSDLSCPTATSCGTRRFGRSTRCSTTTDRKSTRLNSSHTVISYAVFCLKKKKKKKKKKIKKKKKHT